MGRRIVPLAEDPEGLHELVRVLAASVNVRIVGALARARRDNPIDGWMFLSEIAEAVGEKPGTVGIAVQKLLPILVEERRDKGRRYFRSRVTALALVMDDA